MKYKNIKILVLIGIFVTLFFSSIPVLAEGFDSDEVSWEKSQKESGYIGGGFNIAGDAVNEACDWAFGEGACSSESEDIVSFSGFEGGLQPPSKEGLDETLTRSKTAREFIRNTINLALSFLGIIALAIVIYGGFLYITAAGNEEQSGKGKKAVTYAAVGIVIILASWVLVSTLINFVGGEETDEESSGVTESEGGEIVSSDGLGTGIGVGVSDELHGASSQLNNLNQKLIYSLGANEVNLAIKDFLTAYKNRIAVNSIIKKIENLPMPKTPEDGKAYLNTVTSALTEIKNNTNLLTKIHIETQNLLDGWIGKQMAKSPDDDIFKNGKIKTEFEKNLDKLEKASKDDFTDALDLIEKKLKKVQEILGPIANTSDVKNAIQQKLISEKDIQKAFAGIDPNTTVSQIFDEILGKNGYLKAARGLNDNPDQPQIATDFLKSLYKLFLVVKDVKFVYVKIKANTIDGNAPLVVELNGLASRDPTGETIEEDKYIWDPDGDGEDGLKPGNKKVDCNNKTIGPVITCVYNQTGTYMARLSIASQDPARIAPGQAFLPVTVKPNVARISLVAAAGPAKEDLKKYEKNEKNQQWQLTVNKGEFQTTIEEAKKPGVSFDASESTGGDGQPLQSFKWTFGDGTPPEEGPVKTKVELHKYKKEGKYPLMLEVKDSGGRTDRKIVNIVVASIAARIGTVATIGEPEGLMEFDGGFSRSDNGAITSYSWAVINDKGIDITNLQNDLALIGDADGSVLRAKFKKPGTYTVKLVVGDGTNEAQAEVDVSIKSKKPRANFTIRACPKNCVDPTKPALVEFDASMSFDPDPSDILTYEWNFFTENGDKLDSFSQSGKDKDAKKISTEFTKVGKFRASLRVTDSHEDLNILQEDIKEKEFEIKSIVEANWDKLMKKVAKLEKNEAKFDFIGTTKNATRAEVDFGDGESAEGSVEDKFKFEHSYSKAGSYLVKLRAFSEEEKNGENTIMKYVYVSAADSPLAVMEVFVDDVEIFLPEPDLGNHEPALEIIRNKPIKFEARDSINSAGEKDGLKYSWDFGDNKKSTGALVEHSYEDASPEGKPFKVTLTVTEGNTDKNAKAEFFVNVVSKKPFVNNLYIEKKTAGDVTPVDVELTAEGAIDPDGKITNYQFWYYFPSEKDKKLSVTDTQLNHAILTIETAGEENEEHEYVFCVSVTDNENMASECFEMFDEKELPKLKVKNGPNKAPKAEFAVDKTSAKVNEEITFTSSSSDEDGTVKQYVWDFEGNGFQDDNPTELSTVTRAYAKKSPGNGYKVKLKAIDDKNAAGFSKEIPIYISAKSNPPTANFTYFVENVPQKQVKFLDQSTADSANNAKIVKWTWDFDTSAELGCSAAEKPDYCNGDKTDDKDSTDQNPIFYFPKSGIFQVKLTVEDSDGNASEPTTVMVNIVEGASGGTEAGQTPNANILKAVLKTFSGSDGKTDKFEMKNGVQQKVLHMSGEGGNVTLYWGESTGSIAAYIVDKNTWCDQSNAGTHQDGDGNRSNDINNPDINGGSCLDPQNGGAPAEKCWTTNYYRYAKTGHPEGPGHFTAMLTTVDLDGKKEMDRVEIVFDGSTDPAKVLPQNDCDGKSKGVQFLGAGSLFTKLGTTNTILLGLVSGVIVILVTFFISSFLRRGKNREEIN